MNNWRLLLLAVLCTFQPILSEENLFNGRERCSLQRTDYSRRDTRLFEERSFSPIPEIRQVKSGNRRETRETEGQRRIENHGLRYSTRVLANYDEGLDTDNTRSNRVRGFEYRERSGERVNRDIQRFDRSYSSRNNRRESQIRDVRQDKTDIEARIRDRSLTRSLENSARLSRSEEFIRKSRRTLERDVTRTHDTLSRSTGSYFTHNSQTVNQRQVERESTRAVHNNVRLQDNEDNGILHRANVERGYLDESRNFRRELRTSARNYNRIRSLEDFDIRNNKRTHREERQNLRTLARNDRTGSPASDGLRRNNIRQSNSGYRPISDRKLQNAFRLELANRVRRGDFEMNTRSVRDRRIRENEVNSRDFIDRVIREETTLRNINRDSDMNRRRELNRNTSVRSQRQSGSELQSSRTDRFNKITENNRRDLVTPMKQANRIEINGIDRRPLQRERNMEQFRNIEHDNRQKENSDNNRRAYNRQQSRLNKDNSRQNMERDNGRRLRVIENIRVDRIREDIRNMRVSKPVNRDNSFSIKNGREETQSYRTNDLLSTSRGKPSEGVFNTGFELQHLLYVIQAIYLFGLFMTLPRSQDAKKSRMGMWSNTSKLLKVD